jgi:hypothetical protein
MFSGVKRFSQRFCGLICSLERWLLQVRAPVAPETKGADFGYGFCMCLRLGGEKRQADAKHRRRGKLVPS